MSVGETGRVGGEGWEEGVCMCVCVVGVCVKFRLALTHPLGT